MLKIGTIYTTKHNQRKKWINGKRWNNEKIKGDAINTFYWHVFFCIGKIQWKYTKEDDFVDNFISHIDLWHWEWSHDWANSHCPVLRNQWAGSGQEEIG